MKKLHIYDFDATMYHTTEPLTGVHIFKEKTGMDWPYLGWWSKRESLDLSIFDIQLNEWVHSEYLKSKELEDTYTALVTGRMIGIKDAVIKVLERDGISFDEIFCNTGGPTLNFKLRKFQLLFDKFKDTLEEVIIYDDRDEHIGSFMDWAYKTEKETGVKMTVIHVK